MGHGSGWAPADAMREGHKDFPAGASAFRKHTLGGCDKTGAINKERVGVWRKRAARASKGVAKILTFAYFAETPTPWWEEWAVLTSQEKLIVAKPEPLLPVYGMGTVFLTARQRLHLMFSSRFLFLHLVR